MTSVRFLAGAVIFSLRHGVHTGCGTRPTPYVLGTGGSFSTVKRPGREADHSSLTSTESKNVWSCTSVPQYVLMWH
jgi:hypothetical protein